MNPTYFAPDLIVEITRACDRACQGCYAPNVIVARDTLPENSDLFISTTALSAALSNLERPEVIAVRGGEPSLHPELESILRLLAATSDRVIFETHGRWLLGPSSISLKTFANLGITIKVSFDEMHGLDAFSLKAISEKLASNGVSLLVAITESDENAFLETYHLVSDWLDPARVVFQRKAFSADNLIKPRLGVIDSRGKFRPGLTELLSNKKERHAI